MYRLYIIIKNRTKPPTDEELEIACGKKVLDTDTANSYLGQVEVASTANLLSMFTKQSQENAVSDMVPYQYPRLTILYHQEKAFNMETFKRYLAEWVVACDQPFEEVERPELRRLLEYTHMGSKPLNIPHRTALKDRIMKMGKSTVAGIQKLVEV